MNNVCGRYTISKSKKITITDSSQNKTMKITYNKKITQLETWNLVGAYIIIKKKKTKKTN